MKLAAGYPEVTFTVGVLPSSGEGHEDVDLETVVHNADIIITATSATTPLFPSKYVKPGTHLCLIGSYKPEMSVQSRAAFNRSANQNLSRARLQA